MSTKKRGRYHDVDADGRSSASTSKTQRSKTPSTVLDFSAVEVQPDFSERTQRNQAFRALAREQRGGGGGKKKSTKKAAFDPNNPAPRKNKKMHLAAKAEKYTRGERNTHKDVTDLKLKSSIKRDERHTAKAITAAARAEILLPSASGYMAGGGGDGGDISKTWQFSQKDIVESVDARSAAKAMTLSLPQYGPYTHTFNRNGRALLLAGRKGHVALLNWQTQKLHREFQVNETIRDACFLHDESMYALAQKKYVYIYDNAGVELHCLRNHVDVNSLAFLPYHFLLVSIGQTGYLKYQDTSTGANVCEHRTRLGACDVMTTNPHNAIVLCGHKSGVLTMWSPNQTTPLVKMFCHNGPLQAAAVDAEGRHLVTSGLDGVVKVWDVRTYKELHAYTTHRPATTIDISDTGALALAYGPHVQVWRHALATKAVSPYLNDCHAGESVTRVRFCPYEDVLGVARDVAFSTMLVPGAGQANFDSYAANPFQTKKQRRESLVQGLLEKLAPDMIALDEHDGGGGGSSAIGTMDLTSKADQHRDRVLAARKRREEAEPPKLKNKARGRNKSSKRFQRKKKNVIDQATLDRKDMIQTAQHQRKKQRTEAAREKQGASKTSTLDRFDRAPGRR